MSTPILVDTAWLAAHLADANLRILDASYFVPGGIAPAMEQYAKSHVPDAQFFNINDVADPAGKKEHAFPTAAQFAAKVGALGIGNQHHVVAYDHMGGALAAARVWFMFKTFGHEAVSVLDGGRDKWAKEGRTMESNLPTFPAVVFTAKSPEGRVVSKADMLRLALATDQNRQLLDARSAGRFAGTEPEPRAGLRSGHIPHSRNLPFLGLLNADTKTWKDPTAIKAAFTEAGIDLDRPLVTTCGSGVSACTLALGAALAGKTDTAIYDGSWVEWGADASLPLATGPAR